MIGGSVRSMGAVASAVLLAVLLYVPALAADTPVQKFHISVEDQAYVGMPVWIRADLSPELAAHYPYSDDGRNFGNNLIELKLDDRPLTELPPIALAAAPSGPVNPGDINQWMSDDSPTNRLPLHLKFKLNQPGTYSVRWTRVRNSQKGSTIVARSDWLKVALKEPPSTLKNSWLQERVAKAPTKAGLIIGDYLPSILAAAPDSKALPAVLNCLWSSDKIVRSCAVWPLWLFDKAVVVKALPKTLLERGPNEEVAYMVSFKASDLKSVQEDLVRATLPYLYSKNNQQITDSLLLLGFTVHFVNYKWPANSPVVAQADQAVIDVSPKVIDSGDAPAHQLACYLGQMKGEKAREFLWQIASGKAGSESREQALIALTWIADARDLPRLGGLLLKLDPSDKDGHFLYNLPYHLNRAYGKLAIPYLTEAKQKSPYATVRSDAAEQLAQ